MLWVDKNSLCSIYMMPGKTVICFLNNSIIVIIIISSSSSSGTSSSHHYRNHRRRSRCHHHHHHPLLMNIIHITGKKQTRLWKLCKYYIWTNIEHWSHNHCVTLCPDRPNFWVSFVRKTPADNRVIIRDLHQGQNVTLSDNITVSYLRSIYIYDISCLL